MLFCWRVVRDSEPRFARLFVQTSQFLLAQTYSRTPLASLIGFELYYSLSKNKRTAKAAPAIKQVAHGRCLGRRHGRLILPCRFSVFTCFVCAFAHFCATCYRYDTFAHADTDFRVSALLCFMWYSLPVYPDVRSAVSPA